MNTTQTNTTHRIRLVNRLKNKRYRAAYAAAHTKTVVPFQIRMLREERGWSQTKLAKLAKTTQAAISRLEDPDYGNISISTLLKLASCFDNALLVKFVPFSTFLTEYSDKSREALAAKSFAEELDIITTWAETPCDKVYFHIETIHSRAEWRKDDISISPSYEDVQTTRFSEIISAQVFPYYIIGQTIH